MGKKEDSESRQLSATFKVGAIALVFLIIGYQMALFIYRASVVGITEHRDRPDTVYVVDPKLARSLLGVPEHGGLDSAMVEAPASERVSDSQTVLASGAERGEAPVIVRRPASHSPQAEAVHEKYSRRSYESFSFDPNTVSVDDLQRLGFSLRQAEAIDAYRAKGGRFRRREDFARSFVVQDSVYQRLEPYIDIPLLDINRADSAAFDALPGIGPFFASRMVSYRQQLQGYSYPEQLMEIWKFDQEKYDALKDLITVGPAPGFPLWTAPEDSLKLHPYVRGAAHGIVLYRQNTPRGQWSVAGLKAAGILREEDAMRLARCRIAEP